MCIININAENIDYESALGKLGNSIKLYKIILVGFKNKYANAYDDLVTLGIENNYTEAKILSHSLKGVCGNLGANNLEIISRELEYSYLNEDNKHLQLLDAFKQEVHVVLEDINSILECIDGTNESK
ncbi:Hpt domain-containing protein [Vallitalea guaymasensis]|uniref:Hpt domain-containing protein n=1 Tax=Vallitalea guaymasensis TaxID=1185412 RepID=A0A8J8SCB4_9FIRM|nr:Hpt domain-containing protein [Vallitalea guaymasensis]QUH29663.1 Hpt domain-containing protein [Vallitalea guaymasensis]